MSPNRLGITQNYYKINVDKAHKLQEGIETDHDFIGKEKSFLLINIDVSRTYSQLGYFGSDSPLSKDLSDLLSAITFCRPDIGYVQGMSYVAGLLLLNLEQFNAFLVFSNLICSPVLNSFYHLNEAGINKRIDIFKSTFKHNLPELYEHFEREGVQANSFIPEWFITIYAKALNTEIVSRIWD